MLDTKSSSLGAVLCAVLAITQQAGLSSASPVLSDTPLSVREANRAPKALPEKASDRYLAFQPSMDFDTDSCYNWPAIDKDGVISKGVEPYYRHPTAGCRHPSDLDNNNVYARRRCNRGWCAYMYAYYFASDSAAYFGIGSHRHDWEHVIVWTKSDVGAGGVYKNERVEYVGASAHGGYDVRAVKDVRMDGKHPKIVYHRHHNKGGTHSLRFAEKADDKIENHRGVWFRGSLISWDGFPTKKLRQTLLEANFGSAHLALKDGDFTRHLIETMNQKPVVNGPKKGEFDCAYDEEPATSSG